MLLVLSLSLALFLGGVVDVSAAGLGYFSSQGPLMDDATATIGPLKVGQLTTAGRSFLREWQEDSSNWLVTVQSNSRPIVIFMRFPSPASNYFSVSASSYSLKSSVNYSYLSFYLDTGDPLMLSASSHAMSATSIPFNFVQYRYFMQAGLTSAYPNIWKPVKESPTGAFTVLLDDEDPPTPSEPDPPTPSEPDPPPPVSYPDFPVVGPTDNRYIPYDTTVWNQFADHIKKTLGALVPVCLICLSIILGIRVVVKLVNHFAK